MSINEDKLHELLGKAVVDFGATFHAALVQVGDKLGLYKALAAGGPQTPAELAERTGTAEGYVASGSAPRLREAMSRMHSKAAKFSLSEEQAFTLADEKSPAFLPGMFQVALAAIKAEDRITEILKTGKGLGWHEHHPDLFVGTERFFRPGYAANLINSWIPALAGVKQKLEQGATVADVGCGLGASTILMAQSHPSRSSSASIITTNRLRRRNGAPRMPASEIESNSR